MEAVAADHVLTGTGGILSPGWVGFEHGRVTEVAAGRAPRELDAHRAGEGRVVMPGLVCAHAHLPLGGLCGVGDDLPFLDWIRRALMPAVEETTLEPGAFLEGALRSAKELLQGGVTLVGDCFLRPDGAEACRRTGIKGVFFQEVFGSLAEDEELYIHETALELDTLETRLQGFTFGYSPHSPWTCPTRTLQAVVARARGEGRRIALHLDEAPEEHELFAHEQGPLHEALSRRGTLDRYRLGTTPTRYLHELGALGPDVVAAHAVQVTPADVELLASSDTHVVHCPVSNMKLAEGIAPVAEMMEAGVNLSLGTDSAASTGRLDMFEQMRAAILVQRAVRREIGGLTAPRLLEMATRGGAEALGSGHRTGRLEAGLAADLVVVDLARLPRAAFRDPAAALVYFGSPSDVELVLVDGEPRYRRGGG